MILGNDLLTALVMYLQLSYHIIIVSDVPCKGCLAPMDDVTDYKFKSLMDKIIKPE